MKAFFKRSSLFLLGVVCTFVLHAQQPICLDGEKEEQLVPSSALFVLEDSLGILTFSEIQNNAKFQKSVNQFPHIEKIGSTYWVKFSVCANQGALQKRWVLEALDPHFTELAFFKTSSTGKVDSFTTGINTIFPQREYRHKNFVFDLPLLAGDTTTLYLRLKSNNHNVFLFKIRTTNFFTQYALNEYYMLGLYYGILFIMALYNLFLFFTVREKFYLYYVIYVVSSALLSFSEDGIGFHYVWPSLPWFNSIVTFYSPLLFLLCFMLYASSFLELPKRMPIANRVLTGIVVMYAVYFVLDLHWFSFLWTMPVYAVPYALVFGIAIKSFLDGFRPARFFILGYSFILVSIFVLILRMNGKVGWDNIFTIYCFNIGVVIEIVILSLALGDKIKLIKSEKEKAQLLVIEQLRENEKLKDKVNRELEDKVVERTKEISEQKEIIEEQNKELSFANAKLQEQAEEILRMNSFLSEENKSLMLQKEELTNEKLELIDEKKELEVNVKELTKARILMKEVNFSEFSNIFPTKESCMEYLVKLKWENGYKCIRCGNEKYFDGHEPYSRRCTRCGYDESATAYTIFHRLRFPINKAFYMLFLIFSNTGKITSLELSTIVTLRQSTCWSFRKKVLEKMEKKKKSSHQESDGWSWLVLEES